MSSSPIPVPESIIDSHVHLDFPQFDEDRKHMLQRARDVGVSAFVLPAVRSMDWQRVSAVANQADDIYACYGLHPCFCGDHQPSDIESLQAWVARERPVALGECGLDFYQDFVHTEKDQYLYFEAQLSIAKQADLPVVLHARRSVDAVLKCLRQAGVHRGVMHSFSGSLQQAKTAIDQGLFIGVGGAMTHDRARKLRAVLSVLPLDALVLETDAPDQPGSAHRGQRNEPAYIAEVLKALQGIRTESSAAIAQATTANSKRLFLLS